MYSSEIDFRSNR